MGMFRFYTDSTGNNHPVVRQILKRRSWLFRVDKLKGGAHQFEQINLFWTQWKKSSICERLKPHQIYAKIDGNFLLTNKSNLLNTMVDFYSKQGQDPYQYLPETYNIKTQKDM